MHILLIHQYFLEKGDGGGSRFNEMARLWEAKGHQVTVLAGMVHYNTGVKPDKYKGRYIYEDQYSEKVKVIRCHVSEAYNKNFTGRLWGYFSFVFSALYAGMFKAHGQYDVLLATSPPLFVALPAYFISRFKRIPLVFEVRDLWPESAIDTGVLNNKFLIRASFALEKFIYKASSLINVLTPAFRTTLIEKKNVPEDKVVMIPNAADFSLAEKASQDFDRLSLRSELGIDRDTLAIIYVGAHGVANELDQLLNAAKQLSGDPVLFLLVGDGMEKKKLMSRAGKEGIKNVKFLDPVPKETVFKYILISDIGTSVLKNVDTFKTIYSNKTFDYMSCRKPVLLAIDGVSRELVEDAGCGTYVPPENPEAYAGAVRDYLKHPKHIKEQGERGYQYANIHFDRELLAEKFIKELKRCARVKVDKSIN